MRFRASYNERAKLTDRTTSKTSISLFRVSSRKIRGKKGAESKAQTFGKYQIALNMEKSNKVCNVLWYYFSKGEQL